MIRTLVSILCDVCPNGRAIVPADTDSAIPGLGVTKMHLHGPLSELAKRSWVITHLASGVTLGDAFFADRDGADHALRRFGGLPVDWTLPADDPRFRDPLLVAMMVDVIEGAQAMRSGLNE